MGIPSFLKLVVNNVQKFMPSGKKQQKALRSLKDVSNKCAQLNQISSDSVKAYLDDFLCKPGSSRGALATLIESKDAGVVDLDAKAYTSLFLTLIPSGRILLYYD
jgi:hypothetical protein